MHVGYLKQEEVPFRMIDKIKRKLEMVTTNQFEVGYCFNIPIFEKEKKMNKVVRHLLKETSKAKIDTVVLSNFLRNCEFYPKIEEELTQNGIQILNGKRLMNYMNYDILEYILNLQKTDIKQEDVFFLIKKDRNLDLQFLSRFIDNCKTVNIVTNDLARFKKIQEDLYAKEQILISVSNNKSKSLKRAKYIFNVNMNKEDISKFKINRNAIIINFKEDIKYIQNTFDGININYFQITLPDEYEEQFESINIPEEFDRAKLYESILMKKVDMAKKKSELIKQKNIVTNIIRQDDIRVVGLIGNNGKIEESEIIQKN